MKIQMSRNSKQKNKQYSSVCHQQGRMVLDSDLTEQALISRDRLDRALHDVIGSGTPRHDALLRLAADKTPGLYWGRVYVDGVQGDVVPDDSASDPNLFEYAHQKHYPDAPALPGTDYHLYVDVWQRVVIWLQDDKLRDPGLHGADTTTRTQTMAQVKWCPVDVDPLCPDTNPTIGNTRLRLVLRSLATSADPCDPCADELELNEAIGNYLFRVEIHDVHYDENDHPVELVLKWSSENGAEAYNTSDVPPDFVANQFVYEFFDDTTEKHLGNHLARDAANNRIIDGSRSLIEKPFSDASPNAKAYVRRWDGWCRIVKSGSDWRVTEGFEGEIDLSSVVTAGNPGHVNQGGDSVSIELRVITLSIELADRDMIAGDYWIVPVRETVHQQGDVLLESEVSGVGAEPEGELHHYMSLVDVINGETVTMELPGDSTCDDYDACSIAQFPSLTDLRADDICYDNQACEMPNVGTVQGALDYLCKQKDLPWHNKHLHGWGIVCGLALECDKKDADNVILQQGYALDCEGRDLILEQSIRISIPKLLKQNNINPEEIDKDQGQGLCLYLEINAKKQLDIGIERYDKDDFHWTDIFADTLLLDFFEDCILELLNVFTRDSKDDDITARCAITRCGKKLLEPVRRRGLAIANMVYQEPKQSSPTVLNVSPCEHALLKDLYDQLKDILRSKTFCAQFSNNPFPDYPFKNKTVCRGTWFTPENLDHIRLHPNGEIVFTWQRNSSRIYVYKLLKANCIGDLIGYIDVPRLENGTITDLVIDEKGIIHISAIVHQEDTMFLRGEFVEKETKTCEINIKWVDSFICGVKIVNIELSPWSNNHLYAVALCKGIYVFELDKLFEKDKIERRPDWIFPASGHIKFDPKANIVVATAFELGKGTIKGQDCSRGYYNGIVMFNGKPADKPQLPTIHRLFINKSLVQGNDSFDIAPSTKVDTDATGALTSDMHIFVVFNNNKNKFLGRFDVGAIKTTQEKQSLWFGTSLHSFGSAKKASVRYVDVGKVDGVLASRFAMHDLQFIPGDPKLYKTELLPSIPVQTGPVDLVTHDKTKHVYILNHLGQSISLFNYDFVTYQKEREILAKYRAEVLKAFFSLFYGIAQYIKDCFCHHLLVKCPECDEDDKVYLGCLTVDDNDVYHICNFSKRKYVKTFPTLSYWFSLIPLEALIAWAVENLCCLILPDYARKNQEKTITANPFSVGMTKAVFQADQGNIVSALGAKSGDFFKSSISRVVGLGFDNKVAYQDTLKQDYSYKPGVFTETKAVAQNNDAIIDRVEAVERERVVNTRNVEELSLELQKLEEEKTTIEARFETLQAEKQTADTKVAQLQSEVTDLKTEVANSTERFAGLEKGISALEAMRKEIQPILEGAKPVANLEGISDKNLALLQESNIATIGALAAISQEKLVAMGISARTASSMIKKANELIKG